MPPQTALRSVRTGDFKAMLERLPKGIQELSVELYKRFKKDPFDTILENEPLHDTKKGRHRKGSHSVSITRRYRAIYVVDKGRDGDQEEQYCWYWVGSHEDYNSFVGSRRR